DRQHHRDIPDPDWARVVVYSTAEHSDHGVGWALPEARGGDVLGKTRGRGVFARLLDEAVLENKAPHAIALFWDVDAPATLDRLATSPSDPFHALIPRYDMVLTYGGGDPVVRGYTAAGARACVPIYNAL